jgi:broad specificity phosphatase PhoE
MPLSRSPDDRPLRLMYKRAGTIEISFANCGTIQTDARHHQRRQTQAEIEPGLAEWDYGDYEGKRSVDIRKERPDRNVFLDRCPGG